MPRRRVEGKGLWEEKTEEEAENPQIAERNSKRDRKAAEKSVKSHFFSAPMIAYLAFGAWNYNNWGYSGD